MDWTITEEDRKLSEIVDKALHEERQRIQTDDGVVVVISQEELERIEAGPRSLGEHLFNISKIEEPDVSRDESLPHDRDGFPDSDDSTKEANPLIEYLKNGPGFEGVDISRDPSPARDVGW